MSKVTVADVRAKTNDELMQDMLELKKESMGLRFQRAANPKLPVVRFREIRKQIARMKTVLNERKREKNA